MDCTPDQRQTAHRTKGWGWYIFHRYLTMPRIFWASPPPPPPPGSLIITPEQFQCMQCCGGSSKACFLPHCFRNTSWGSQCAQIHFGWSIYTRKLPFVILSPPPPPSPPGSLIITPEQFQCMQCCGGSSKACFLPHCFRNTSWGSQCAQIHFGWSIYTRKLPFVV